MEKNEKDLKLDPVEKEVTKEDLKKTKGGWGGYGGGLGITESF